MSKPKPDRHAPDEVDAYLAAQTPEFRATLEQLRAVITSPCGAPKPATVLISTLCRAVRHNQPAAHLSTGSRRTAARTLIQF